MKSYMVNSDMNNSYCTSCPSFTRCPYTVYGKKVCVKCYNEHWSR